MSNLTGNYGKVPSHEITCNPPICVIDSGCLALRRAKRAGKQPGCHYGGITLPSGRKAFAIYRDGKVVEKYTA